MSSDGPSYTLRALPIEHRKLWDNFVTEHPAGHIFQSWGWGDLKAHAGWHPLRLALYNETSQQIVAAAQVLQRTTPHFPLWVGHLAYIPRGPLLDWSQPLLCDAFFAQLDRYLYRHGALALQMELGQEVGSTDEELIKKRLATLQVHPVRTIQTLRTIMLDLTPDEQQLLAQMKRNWRYNVGLAERKGVTIRIAQGLDDLRAWYTLLQLTSERDQFGIHTFDYFLHAWELFAPRNEAQLFLAEYNGQLLAGSFLTMFAHRATYLYGASGNEQRQLKPNYLLQWEAIRWAKQQGARQYDFGGIPETEAKDEAMAGVYEFKRGWGGHVVSFLGSYERVYHLLTMGIARRFLLKRKD